MHDDLVWVDHTAVKRHIAEWAADKPAVKRIYKVSESAKSGGKIDLAFDIHRKALRAEYGPTATWETVAADWHAQLSELIPYSLDIRPLTGGRDPISGKNRNEADQVYIAHSLHRWESFFGSIFFLGFAALEGWLFLSGELDRKAEWFSWLVGLGAIGFFVTGVFLFVAWARNWSPDKTEKAGAKAIGFAVATPFVIIGCLIALWLLLWAFGWLSSIPAWAAVMIVLLVLILMKKK